MVSDLLFKDATELAHLIKSGAVSAVSVVEAHLAQIAAIDSRTNAIVTLNDGAIEAAKAADAAVKAGQVLGPLHGVPFTVKDSIDTALIPTQRGSPIFKGRTPDIDAVSVARMKAAGAIVLAKTNLPEFSYSIESDNLLTGRTNNPWDLTKTAGGSSGGESAAIAAGMSPLGLGTDLAISVRGPAAQTGIVSLKATHGRVPMTGVWPRAPRRFWHTGPMARSIRDLSLAFSILAGPDGLDSLSTIANQNTIQPPQRQLKIGWLVEPGFGPIDPEVGKTVEAAAEALRTSGCAVEAVRVKALELDNALEVFKRLHVNEMKPAFVEATAGRSEDELFRISRRMLGMPISTVEDFVAAEQASDRLKDGFAEYFTQYDALLCPVMPTTAHEHNMTQVEVAGHMLDPLTLMSATVPFNVTGLPALSMRFGTSSRGLPINVQLVGTWYAEPIVLHLASMLEAVSPARGLHPQL